MDYEKGDKFIYIGNIEYLIKQYSFTYHSARNFNSRYGGCVWKYVYHGWNHVLVHKNEETVWTNLDMQNLFKKVG